MRTFILLLVCALAITDAAAASDLTVFGMDSVQHVPLEFTREKTKHSTGTAELVEGKFGKAVKFTFVEGASGGFMVGRVRPTPAWDKADGFSFWVKGDGSHPWGGIELIDANDYALRYAYCFPTDSTDWQKVVVRWSDLTPELAGLMADPGGGFAPSHLGTFSFGKWFYWRDYPAQAYSIDQVQLEPTIPAAEPVKIEPGLARVRAKLEAHQPITIVTMGDSLTDEHHWSNRTIVWHRLLADKLKAKYGSEVKLVNPAIGGTTLSQNMVLMPRWSKDAPAPDLVTIWFGGNDWGTGVRGRRFAEYLRVAVDRIRQQTGGRADVLLMTTCPSHDHWNTMAELEQAVRDVAKEKQTGLGDVSAEFHKLSNPDEGLKGEYWAWDKVHLGKEGHARTCAVVMDAIEAAR